MRVGSEEPVAIDVRDGIAVIRLDDGKVNALTHETITLLHAALDVAARDAAAICIVGNERALSAGFDLAVISAGGDDARALVSAGAELLLRVYAHPRPTVVAVTGHALAAGALLLLACDMRVCVDGDLKIGLNEVAIGVRLPQFALALASARLSTASMTEATLQAATYAPHAARAAGFVDVVVTDPVERAMREAATLCGAPSGSYAGTKHLLRRRLVDEERRNLLTDLATWPGGVV